MALMLLILPILRQILGATFVDRDRTTLASSSFPAFPRVVREEKLAGNERGKQSSHAT
jgi:hypothetical protein